MPLSLSATVINQNMTTTKKWATRTTPNKMPQGNTTIKSNNNTNKITMNDNNNDNEIEKPECTTSKSNTISSSNNASPSVHIVHHTSVQNWIKSWIMMMLEAVIKDIMWMIHVWQQTLFQLAIKQEAYHHYHMRRPKLLSWYVNFPAQKIHLLQ